MYRSASVFTLAVNPDGNARGGTYYGTRGKMYGAKTAVSMSLAGSNDNSTSGPEVTTA
jgi:hypothetical protein